MRSYVYFFFSDDKVKIGKANDVGSRLKSVRTHCPSKVKHLGHIECESERTAFELEKELHEKYDQYRENGEWFFISKYEAHDIIRDYSKTVPSGFLQYAETDSINLFDGLDWIGSCYYTNGMKKISVQVFEDNYNPDYVVGVETVYGKGKVNVDIRKHPNGIPDHYDVVSHTVKQRASNDFDIEDKMKMFLKKLYKEPYTVGNKKSKGTSKMNGIVKENKITGETEMFVSVSFFNSLFNRESKRIKKKAIEKGLIKPYITCDGDVDDCQAVKINGVTQRCLKMDLDFVKANGYDFTTKL